MHRSLALLIGLSARVAAFAPRPSVRPRTAPLRSEDGGFLATCVSDCTSNSIRVLKTTRQTSATEISYREAATQIIEKEGIKGLFGRGLGTRILTNGVQASLFTVIWKYLEEFYFKV